ncbi:MAG: single-stranded-DNA-specific exonuclease RecJ, partial [Bacillota bacterium]
MLRYIPAYTGLLSEEELNEKACALQEALCISFITAKFLTLRGMDAEAAHAFLHHGFDHLHDPFLLPGMEAGVERIKKAYKQGERITVFGDYDADGVCASVLLVRSMRERGFDVDYYLPSRQTEGYGLNCQALDTIAQNGTRLIITVDCGITAAPEAAYAKSLGIDMIITDHHQAPDEIPDATACIAATLPYSQYPFDGLCGTGIAAKLVQALFGKAALRKHIGIVGLATVADLVPLFDENRILVKEGLCALRERPSVGIQAMCACAEILPDRLNAYQLGFVLGPRINAAGRMSDASFAAELLLTDDPAKARELAMKLEKDNTERRKLEQEIMQQVLEKLKDTDVVNVRAIVMEKEGWDHGVIGIVASRLAEMLCMPVVLFSREGDVLKGSGRSVAGVHLFNLLKNFEHLFERFGGHAQAAGMTLHAQNFDAFAKGFEELVRMQHDEELFMPSVRYDIQVSAEDVSAQLARELEFLEPFGIGNPMPVLRIEASGAFGVTTMGADNRHVRFSIPSQQGCLDCIAFGSGELAAELGEKTGFEMLITPQINRWGGRERLQCLVRHFNLSAAIRSPEAYANLLRSNFADAIIRQIRYNGNIKFVYPADTITSEDILESFLLENLQTRTRGTLLLCNTPAGAVYTLCLLQKLELLDRVLVRRNAPGDVQAAFNTLLIAPFDPSASCLYFKRVLVMDALPFPDSVPEHVAQYRGAILKESAGFIEKTVFGRQELLEVYAALRHVLRRP